MTYNDEPLEYVQSFKYLGLNFNSKCSFTESLDKLCSQARKAQTVLDLHVMKHPTMSVERALQLFDSLIKPIVMFDSEVWGVGNCGEIDKGVFKGGGGKKGCWMLDVGCWLPLNILLKLIFFRVALRNFREGLRNFCGG